MLIKDVLRELDLGSSVAEHDEALEDYFIETDVFRALVEDRRDAIAGDKGTGKTALYRILQKRYPSLLSDVGVLPGFNPAGAPVFQRLTEGEPMSEGQYITIWKAYFLSLVGNWILQLNEGGFSHKMTELDELLTKTGLSSADDSANTIFSQIVNLFRRITNPKSAELAATITPDGLPVIAPKVELMRSHTVVAVDAGTGRQLEELSVRADEAGHRRLLEVAARLSNEREWAIEDCRNLSRHLEAALLRAGERVRRVPPKLMSGARKSARTFGKSDPIDALAVARAALREPDLPVAQLAGPEREIALVLDHRANLIVERTRLQSRLRWLLYELDPTIELAGRSLDNPQVLERLKRRLAKQPPSVLLRICRELLARIRELTVQVRALQRDLRPLVARHAPALLSVPGVGTINAARLLAEVADVRRFKTEAQLALYAGVAPLDASSGRQQRHRLNRSGNRQLNAALHMIALTQARLPGPAKDYIARRRSEGKTGREAMRALKRHLIRTIYRLLRACAEARPAIPVSAAPLTPCIT